jgi:hypothetical protein
MLKLRVVCLSTGLSAAVSFFACVAWGFVTPESLHMHAFLELILPGFKWLTAWSFLLGLVESFLFGAYAGLVFVPIYNTVNRRWGDPASRGSDS